MAKNLPANAGDRVPSWSGKIPHASRQLSPWAKTTEAQVPRACALQREGTAMRSPRTATESTSCLLQPERACTATKTQDSQKSIFRKYALKFMPWCDFCTILLMPIHRLTLRMSYYSIFSPLILTSILWHLYTTYSSVTNTNTLGNTKVMNTFKYRNRWTLKWT